MSLSRAKKGSCRTQGSNSVYFFLLSFIFIFISVSLSISLCNYKGYFMGRTENVHNKLIKWLLPLKGMCVCVSCVCAVCAFMRCNTLYISLLLFGSLRPGEKVWIWEVVNNSYGMYWVVHLLFSACVYSSADLVWCDGDAMQGIRAHRNIYIYVSRLNLHNANTVCIFPTKKQRNLLVNTGCCR